MEFQLSYFKYKRWCSESASLNMKEHLENSEVATELEKVSFHSNPKERQCQRMFKLPQNCTHFTSQQCHVQILQARLRQFMNWELLDVQAGFRKGRRTRDQIANICWISQKQESSSETSTSVLLITPKPLTVWITTNCEKFLKRLENQTTLLTSWETCMQVKKQQLEVDMEQQTGSK